VSRCPINGCTRNAKPNQMMCLQHWRRVPRALNKAIFETYANGTRDSFRAYRANRAEAIRVVNEKEAINGQLQSPAA
jgi:hypothetical protein